MFQAAAYYYCWRGNSLVPRPPRESLILRSHMCAVHYIMHTQVRECKHVKEGLGVSESQKSKVRPKFMSG